MFPFPLQGYRLQAPNHQILSAAPRLRVRNISAQTLTPSLTALIHLKRLMQDPHGKLGVFFFNGHRDLDFRG